VKKIAIVYIEAGEGHRAAARALSKAIQLQQRPWKVELVNADEVLEPADPAFLFLGVRTNEIYNWLVRRGWVVATKQLLPIVHFGFRLLNPAVVLVLRRYWRKLNPDLVISVVPHRNRALYDSLRKENGRVPFVTVLTDLADYPPYFWIERQRQHFICGTSAAVRQAEAINPPAEGIWPVSGMIVDPKFYDREPVDIPEERRKLGLDPDLPTGLVLFGGYGSHAMLRIAKHASKAKTPFQLIFVCGRNATLLSKLQSFQFSYPSNVQGFTDNIVHLMALSDFLIGKPGPGVISEALTMRLPVIVTNGWRTMIHERFNVRWIEEQGVGLAVKRSQDIPKAIEQLLNPTRYSSMRRRIKALNNQAVFEIPHILEQILDVVEDSITSQCNERPLANNVCGKQPTNTHAQ